MNFSTHQDVDAPIQYVFQRVSNFGAYERQALRMETTNAGFKTRQAILRRAAAGYTPISRTRSVK